MTEPTTDPDTEYRQITSLAVFSLGGTIVSTSEGAGAEPRITVQDLLDGVAVPESIRLTARTCCQKPSTELFLADLSELVRSAAQAVEDGAQGVVVTTGTDTLQEVAFALDLLWEAAEPLVLTAAMRPADRPGADGPANLASALRVAAMTDFAGLGCVVVLNDQIHAARHVQKRHTTNPAAFTSPNAGPIGFVHESGASLLVKPCGRPSLPKPRQGLGMPHVAIVPMCLDDDGRLLSAIAGLGFDGVVLDAAGGGAVPAAWVPHVAKLSSNIPTIYASRTGAGPVNTASYSGPGLDIDLQRNGAIPSGLLTALQSRILLAQCISAGLTREQIAETFRDPFGQRSRSPGG
ncbi:MAG TPA: asparaginase [Amycolatopsis sp.]|nr:asparaginase [Amycolatopsis sp.]